MDILYHFREFFKFIYPFIHIYCITVYSSLTNVTYEQEFLEKVINGYRGIQIKHERRRLSLSLCTKVAKVFGKILNAHALVSGSTHHAGRCL